MITTLGGSCTVCAAFTKILVPQIPGKNSSCSKCFRVISHSVQLDKFASTLVLQTVVLENKVCESPRAICVM